MYILSWSESLIRFLWKLHHSLAKKLKATLCKKKLSIQDGVPLIFFTFWDNNLHIIKNQIKLNAFKKGVFIDVQHNDSALDLLSSQGKLLFSFMLMLKCWFKLSSVPGISKTMAICLWMSHCQPWQHSVHFPDTSQSHVDVVFTLSRDSSKDSA